jgi:hypothetical protein
MPIGDFGAALVWHEMQEVANVDVPLMGEVRQFAGEEEPDHVRVLPLNADRFDGPVQLAALGKRGRGPLSHEC